MSEKTETAELTRLLAVMDETGWGDLVIRRRAEHGRACALGKLGIVSSMDLAPGEDEWKLNLTRTGYALRRALIAQEAAINVRREAAKHG